MCHPSKQSWVSQVLMPPCFEVKMFKVGSPTLAVERDAMCQWLRKLCNSSAVLPAAHSTLTRTSVSSGDILRWPPGMAAKISFVLLINRNLCSFVTIYIYMTYKLNRVGTRTQLSTVCNSCHSPWHSFGLGQVALHWTISGTVWELALFRDHS